MMIQESADKRLVRSSDAAGAGLRHPQELHLHPGAPNCLCYAKDCQGFEILGVEHWQEARGLSEGS